MNQPLAIVGASTRSAAASAVRAGFQPLAADLFADADLRQIATATRIRPYPEGLLDWLRAVEPPAWMYTGALENYPELVDQMAWIAPLWGNSGDVLARVRSPWELAHVLHNARLLFPEIRASADGLPRDGSWLAKSYHGASGSGVRLWGRESGTGGGQSDSNSIGAGCADRCCFQQRIAGTPCAAAFVGAGGTATLLGVTRQLIGEEWLGAHGFQYAGSIGPWPITDTTLATIQSLGARLVEQFELIGLFGVDFILDGEDVWTLEVNPRYTASMEICERATGIFTIAAHTDAWFEPTFIKLPAARIVPELAHGKAIMFAKRDIKIPEAFANAALVEALRQPWPTLADVSPAGTTIEAGRPILTVFAKGRSIDLVEIGLRNRVQELEQQIYASEVPS